MLDQTFGRSVAVIEGLRSRIDHIHRLYEERPELVGASALLEFLGILLNDSEARLGRLRAEAEAESEANPDQAGAIAQEAADVVADETRALVDSLELCLAILARPHGEEISPFIGPVARLGRLIAAGTEMLVHPIAAGGEYQITQSLNQDWLLPRDRGEVIGAGVAETLASLPTLVVLNYPETDEPDSFSHLILGHELAHLILRQSDLAGRLSEHGLKATEEPADEARNKHFIDRVGRWSLELAADRLGLRLIGPGLFFALLELASLREWQYPVELGDPGSDYNRYPAFAWRLELLGDLLVTEYLPAAEADSDSSEDSAFAKARGWERLAEHVAGLRQQIPAWSDPEAGAERAAVEAALTLLAEQEQSLLPNEPRPEPAERPLTAPSQAIIELLAQDSFYRPQRFQADLPLVWDKIADEMAPAERVLSRSEVESQWKKGTPWSVPIDWRSILVGSYLYWLLGSEDAGEIEERKRLSAVARSGVELSEIHRRALELRDELRDLKVPLLGAD